ncbi:S-adenosylhomocysteine deaminase [Oceanidesulfovibrio indonesiensis]|uniref:5-methylthioadenosine/S-adenosylhomocysteine deaminase n=1 Tax=Oceanidesulfovibrio indonesiensis TaxID=54767 RepID=A0A7M3MGP6_9BACT|nr:amidohydrolase [Oceanidesulfovibrio indonesiensis]TVM18486.1 S-adenosylhomocysteine deaminase [Oceanidesulfovibrio indonesiensis]
MNPSSCDYIIHAAWLITQDHERRVIENAGVAVSNGRILDVGVWDDINREYEGDELLPGRELLVMPGLVNAHTHAPMTLFRGLADDLPLMEWLQTHVFPVEQKHTPESVYFGALLACAEMTRFGVTTFCDMHFMAADVWKAVDDSGLRALVGEAIFGFPNPSYANFEEACIAVEHLIFKHHGGSSRIAPILAPHSVYTTTPDMLTTTYQYAEDNNLKWMIHLAETQAETAECVQKHGKRPLAYIDSLGCLGPRTVIAHGVDLEPDELDRIAKAGAGVVHCPKSNMKLASGVAPAPAMRARGVRTALGTDGAASNNTLGLFTEMRYAALLHKAHTRDATVMDAQSVLDIATCEGARVLGLEKGTGAITPGSPADIIALDLTRPNLRPCYNPVSHVVYAAEGGEVCMTMVAGEVLYKDGAFTRIDYPALLDRIRTLGGWVREINRGSA